jgi:PTS system cellobiose-specific IIA component
MTDKVEDTFDINQVAMNVILNAGNARENIDAALEKMANFDFSAATTQLQIAEQQLLKAHNAQTMVIQRQAGGDDMDYSLLFVHAQDTMMTINTELRMAQKMQPIFVALYHQTKGDNA